MHALEMLLSLAAIIAIGLRAEDPNVKIDGPQARVLLVTEEPHHRNGLHQHTVNRVMVYLDGGEMTFTTPSGKAETLQFKAGDVKWSPTEGPHTSENSGARPLRIVEIELKNQPQPAVPLSDLDPARADPKHYHLEFENGQVRVLRVRFGPNEMGVLHEHKLNHIVVYLTDQARGKAGEVRQDEPMKHTEQNPLDHPVERIAIDLK